MKGYFLVPRALAAAVVLILVSGFAVLAAAGPVFFSHAPLNPNGEAFEVNPGAANSVWISDYGANEVWQVQANDSYTAYGGLGGGISDARPGAAGEVWYAGVDNCTLNRLMTTPPGATSWSLGTGCVPQATAYDGSRVWVADFLHPRLYSFNGSNLCTYALPNAGVPRFLGLQGGQIWFGDTTNGRIVRLDPSTNAVTSWQMAAAARPFHLAVDADNTVWWTDREGGTVSHFAPATNQLTTYTLAAGSVPAKLTTSAGSAWYTDDQTHVIGKIDPATASGAVSTLTATSATVSPACQSAPAPTTRTVTVRSGILDWTAATVGSTTTNGVTTYNLGASALPWGIASAGSELLIADRDPGNKVLHRIEGAGGGLDLSHKLYLPIIAR